MAPMDGGMVPVSLLIPMSRNSRDVSLTNSSGTTPLRRTHDQSTLTSPLAPAAPAPGEVQAPPTFSKLVAGRRSAGRPSVPPRGLPSTRRRAAHLGREAFISCGERAGAGRGRG
eukprot:CAMPEP_0182479060 /NCGR_PEP_ID=MMETSP1319-20130603/33537_1 /TAXON_ID=172717 /ORGANISM="Bolidomonas pacifica, Strain RCC208" /LENGTH=113 /DNA_ID=CAMNT_0024680457 /DNA_START=400 /DNA_END=741 /DNA_ORIENTATION=-